MQKQIKIDSVSQSSTEYGQKVVLESGKEKYTFFSTKKDGSQTKAYEQFTKYGFKVGDTVSAEVDEEQKTFTNKEGKDIKYVDRKIMYFAEVDHLPVAEFAPKKPQEKATAQQDGFTEADRKMLQEIYKKVINEEIPF